MATHTPGVPALPPLPLPPSLRPGFHAFAAQYGGRAAPDTNWCPEHVALLAQNANATAAVVGTKVVVDRYEDLLILRKALLSQYDVSLHRDSLDDPAAQGIRGTTVLVHNPDLPDDSHPVRLVLTAMDDYASRSAGAADAFREVQIMASCSREQRAPNDDEQVELDAIAHRTHIALGGAVMAHNLANPDCQILVHDPELRRAQVVRRAHDIDRWITGRTDNHIPPDAALATISLEIAFARRARYGDVMRAAHGERVFEDGADGRIPDDRSPADAYERTLVTAAIDEHRRGVSRGAHLAALDPRLARNAALARLHRVAEHPAELLSQADIGVRLTGAVRLIEALTHIQSIDRDLAAHARPDKNAVTTMSQAREALHANLAPLIPPQDLPRSMVLIENTVAQNRTGHLDSTSLAQTLTPRRAPPTAQLTTLLGMNDPSIAPNPTRLLALAIETYALQSESVLLRNSLIRRLQMERNHLIATSGGAITAGDRPTFTTDARAAITSVLSTAATAAHHGRLTTATERRYLSHIQNAALNPGLFPPASTIIDQRNEQAPSSTERHPTPAHTSIGMLS